jgi:hypothetical protein
MKVPVAHVGWLAVTALVAMSAPAAAEIRFLIDDHNPEASLPDEAQRESHPRALRHLQHELTARGEAASQRGDHLAAARYYSALAQMVPDQSLPYARLCHALEILGEREGAIDACADALARDGVTVEDFAHYVRLILGKPGVLGAVDRRNVDAQIALLSGLPGGSRAAAQLQCELGTRIGDPSLLGWCTSAQAADPLTRAYQTTIGALVPTGWGDANVRLLVLVAIAGGAIFFVVRRLFATAA